MINLWEKIQNGPCITTDRYPPLRHNPYQRQPEQLRRPHTLGYSSASGHLDGSWLPSAAVLRASKTIVVTIVVSLPSTGLKEANDGGRPSIDGRQALVHAWLPPQPPSRAFFKKKYLARACATFRTDGRKWAQAPSKIVRTNGRNWGTCFCQDLANEWPKMRHVPLPR